MKVYMLKDEILLKLKEEPYTYISGSRLSKQLNVTRSAIWKHINELKRDGYNIESSARKGYMLVDTPDNIDAFEISYKLGTKILGSSIKIFNTMDSTNNYAKKLAVEGCSEGTTVIAEEQISGRGRIGRDWSSPSGRGIWMSIVLRPPIEPNSVQIITLAAAAAVTNAIKKVTGISVGIKWPNDIVLEGRKLCGILTEMGSEMDRVNYVVVGIGINIGQEKDDFPENIRDKAVSLKSYAMENRLNLPKIKRNDIIKETLIQLERLYGFLLEGNTRAVTNEWRSASATLGKKVRVLFKNSEYQGVAEDITEEGHLLVYCDDGQLREIVSGEISVRGMLGYI